MRNVADEKETSLEKSEGGWKWKETARIDYRVSGKEMELSIPLTAVGIFDVRVEHGCQSDAEHAGRRWKQR
jgi:hypothetical protein